MRQWGFESSQLISGALHVGAFLAATAFFCVMRGAMKGSFPLHIVGVHWAKASQSEL